MKTRLHSLPRIQRGDRAWKNRFCVMGKASRVSVPMSGAYPPHHRYEAGAGLQLFARDTAWVSVYNPLSALNPRRERSAKRVGWRRLLQASYCGELVLVFTRCRVCLSANGAGKGFWFFWGGNRQVWLFAVKGGVLTLFSFWEWAVWINCYFSGVKGLVRDQSWGFMDLVSSGSKIGKILRRSVDQVIPYKK
jgi:hypothetical protein